MCLGISIPWLKLQKLMCSNEPDFDSGKYDLISAMFRLGDLFTSRQTPPMRPSIVTQSEVVLHCGNGSRGVDL